MGQFINSATTYAAHAIARREVIDRHTFLALAFSVTQIISFWRGIDGFPIQTGNLQHSVGVNRRITASRQKLSSLPSSAEAVDVKALVKKRAAGYTILLPVGMEYAKHLEPRMGIPQVLTYARIRLDENFQKGMRNAIAEVVA